MKICLTGGNSRLAEAFIALAASHPHIRLRVLGRAHPSLTAANIEWVSGDLNDATVCQKLLSGQDVLIHLAWRGAPLAAGSFARGLSEGLLPSARLLDAVTAHGQLRVVYASSGGTVYEDRPQRRAYSEDDPCLPKSPYGIQKLAVEYYLQALCAAKVCCASVLRISTAYGWTAKVGAQQGFISIACASALEGKPIRLLGDPDNVRDFVHRDDVARALLSAAIEKPIAGDFKIINIGSGVGTSVRDVVRLISLELGHEVETVHEYRKEALGLPAYSVLNISRARDLLGWTPQIDVRAGIRRGLKEQAETIKKAPPQTAQTPAPIPHKWRA